MRARSGAGNHGHHRGLDGDRRHIFNATYVYELPFFKEDPNAILRWTLGGWQVSGITTISSARRCRDCSWAQTVADEATART